MDTARTISQVSQRQRKIWITVCFLTVLLLLAANSLTAYAAPPAVSIVNQGIYGDESFAWSDKAETLGVVRKSDKQTAASGAGGTITLSAGLTADPYRANVLAMGTRAASSLSSDCAGYIGSHPTTKLNWSGRSPELHIFVTSAVDTILLVKDPSGGYHCSDDWTANSSIDPMLRFAHPAEGEYVIWVGKYDIGGTADALLYFSEQENLNPSNPQLLG